MRRGVPAGPYAARAMARTTVHVCAQCGFQSAQWHGQCPGCEAWNTLVEEPLRPAPARAGGRAGGGGVGAGRRALGVGNGTLGTGNGPWGADRPGPRRLAEVGAAAVQRLSTGIGELDRVLGGGLVPGSLVLLGGSPGIGKSTLTNMVLGHLQQGGHRTLYVSGEESAEQVRLRAERLAGAALQVPVLAETDLDTILETIAAEAPQACVIDSVQTLGAAELSGAPGSVGQVREVAARVMALAKASGVAVILVGHVTKDGALAGPRVLEHLVDCVLQFEGERERPYRELRALKNRFGSTNEAGLFEMRQGGLVEVLDASARFVAEATRAPGSVVLAAMEGSRPLLVEVQALVAPSELEQPRRVVSGIDRNRLALVLAILGRHGGVGTGGADVFVNVVGGVRVDEPGCDLAVALAVASASRGVAIEGSHPPTPRACFGELGLTGELRWVGHPERRLAEAAKHGCAAVIAPPDSGGEACEVATLREALGVALPAHGRRPARAAA
jgi:DNA repair protein RadA/Sms